MATSDISDFLIEKIEQCAEKFRKEKRYAVKNLEIVFSRKDVYLKYKSTRIGVFKIYNKTHVSFEYEIPTKVKSPTT